MGGPRQATVLKVSPTLCGMKQGHLKRSPAFLVPIILAIAGEGKAEARDGGEVLGGVRLPRDHKLPNPNSSLPGSGSLGKLIG